MRSHECLIFLNLWPHIGEPAVATGKKRIINGEVEAEVRMVMCEHEFEVPDRTVWIKREHIKL